MVCRNLTRNWTNPIDTFLQNHSLLIEQLEELLPILTKFNIPFPVIDVFNNKEVILMWQFLNKLVSASQHSDLKTARSIGKHYKELLEKRKENENIE